MTLPISTPSSTPAARPKRPVMLFIGLYALAYAVASGLDLWTTHLVLVAGGSEANVFVVSDQGYEASLSFAITIFGGAILVGAFAFGAAQAAAVAERWLAAPLRSFGHPYLNPFAPSVRDRAPLHLFAQSVAFAFLRVLAAGNNLMILSGGTGPIGWAVRRVGQMASPMIGFVVVMVPLFALLTLAAAPLCAWFVGRYLR
jgi:hypothetical protein